MSSNTGVPSYDQLKPAPILETEHYKFKWGFLTERYGRFYRMLGSHSLSGDLYESDRVVGAHQKDQLGDGTKVIQVTLKGGHKPSTELVHEKKGKLKYEINDAELTRGLYQFFGWVSIGTISVILKKEGDNPDDKRSCESNMETKEYVELASAFDAKLNGATKGGQVSRFFIRYTILNLSLGLISLFSPGLTKDIFLWGNSLYVPLIACGSMYHRTQFDLFPKGLDGYIGLSEK